MILELLKYEGLTGKKDESGEKKMSALLEFIAENVNRLVEKLKDAPMVY